MTVTETGSVEIVVERGVMVPMRDGVRLAADVWRRADGQPEPVLICRTPYGRSMLEMMGSPVAMAKAGFAVVHQDCRGRFESEGSDWRPIDLDIDDGYDTVEWAAAQPWSNGKVGLFGASYMGYTQWQAAIAHPPSLVAILPETAAADYWDPAWGPGGAFRVANRVGWAFLVGLEEARRQRLDDPMLTRIRDAMEGIDPGDLVARNAAFAPIEDEMFRHRPLRDIPFLRTVAPWYADYFDRSERDHPAWLSVNPLSHMATFDLLAIHVGGWYDVQLSNTILSYQGMTTSAATERARRNQRLIIGPWPHWSVASGIVGELDFGPDAVLDTTALRLDWFSHWLKDQPSALVDQPPVRLFVMGENVWRDEQEWPLARTEWTPWYLHGDGRFSADRPRDDEPPDQFTFDPRDPVPTRGGRLLGVAGVTPGAVDQRELEDRADVLVYTSEVLTGPIEITGPVRADLWVATTAADTDFTAKLIDVHPDGRAFNICDGIVRARTVASIPLVAGATYCLTIDLAATSIVLPAGHRLRVHVSSSNFPMFEPNANTGNPAGTDTEAELRSADQTVFHDRARPSRIVLPLIPR